MLYHGVLTKDGLYRVGVMLLDLEDPTKIIVRGHDYVMETEFDYETDGFYQGCAFSTGNVIVDGTLYVYYGGADRFVCVATCEFDEILEFVLKYKK